jgi:hypothetical protein
VDNVPPRSHPKKFSKNVRYQIASIKIAASASDSEDEFDPEGHDLIGREKEEHRDNREDQDHHRRDHGFAPGRPRHLPRFRPYLLQEGKGVRSL